MFNYVIIRFMTEIIINGCIFEARIAHKSEESTTSYSEVSPEAITAIKALFDEHIDHHNLNPYPAKAIRFSDKGLHYVKAKDHFEKPEEKVFSHDFALTTACSDKYQVNQATELWKLIMGHPAAPDRPKPKAPESPVTPTPDETMPDEPEVIDIPDTAGPVPTEDPPSRAISEESVEDEPLGPPTESPVMTLDKVTQKRLFDELIRVKKDEQLSDEARNYKDYLRREHADIFANHTDAQAMKTLNTSFRIQYAMSHWAR
jgi:hypothetical protein